MKRILWCVSSKAIIFEACELFDRPTYFHLGMADETIEYQQYYGLSIVHEERAFWRDAYALFDACRTCGARPIRMFSDL